MSDVAELIADVRNAQAAVELAAVRYANMGPLLEDKDIAERALFAWLDDKLAPHTSDVLEMAGGYLAGMYDAN